MSKIVTVLCVFWIAGWARGLDEFRVEQDQRLPPWIQYYNRLKGQPKLSPWQQDEPESLNVRLVGKWGRGPAARVTGRDSLVYLALGSEVAIFNAADGHNPRILNEVQCRFVVDNVILRDTVLYAVLQGGVEIFNIANPRSVTRIRYLPIGAVDMCIDDSLAYTIDADSFKAYRIVSPESLERLGACADSGYYLAADSGFAYACDRWGLYVIDATDPRNPHQVSTLSGGVQTGAAWVDSGYCYYTETYPNSAFVIANVANPSNPSEMGRLSGIASYDLYKLSYFVYLPNYDIIDVSTPSQPAVVGSRTPGGNGVWTRSPFSYSFIAAGSDGMGAVNINDPVHPVFDTSLAGADVSQDVCSDSSFTYIANMYGGMKVLSIANPVLPEQIGSYDTAGAYAPTLRVRDSAACVLTEFWTPYQFRVVSIADRTRPALTGGCLTWNPGEAVVVRDSLAYVAEDYKLEIFFIANPRNPRLVGSCGLPEASSGLCIQDTFAYIAPELRIVNIADPARPYLVHYIPWYNAGGISVQDTFAYCSHAYDSLTVFSVADPMNPRELGWAPINYGTDVVVHGNRAYVGCVDFRVFDISDPGHPTQIGYYATPYRVRRVYYSEPYVYAACFDAGVCIFETMPSSGVADTPLPTAGADADRLRMTVSPNPTQSDVELQIAPCETGLITIKIADVTGRKLIEVRLPVAAGKAHLVLPEGKMPPGVYFVTAKSSTAETTIKVVKQ